MPKNGGRKKMVRLSLATSAKLREKMERLVESTDAASISEVIARAISLYDWWQRQATHGAMLFVQELPDGEKREVIVPELCARD